MPLRERSQSIHAALRVAAPALLLLFTSLTEALQRWRWQHLCERICGPFLPADMPAAWSASWHRALDWHTPLAVAGAAALVLLALWIGLCRGRSTTNGRKRDG